MRRRPPVILSLALAAAIASGCATPMEPPTGPGFLGGKDISLWMSAYPSGFQPYRQSHFIIDEWVNAGYEREFIEDYLSSNADSYNHPNAANEPRIPGIFSYYSRAEDELVKGLSTGAAAQDIADSIAAAWDELTDQIGRDQQLALYRESLGLPPLE